MDMHKIIETVSRFDGVLVVLPDASGPFPELAWGDAFFYFAPDGIMPERTQPYGTIITKNYPDDAASALDDPGRFRVNIHVGRERAALLADPSADPAATDVFSPHPLYGAAGWISVVNPGPLTEGALITQLRDAHEAARVRTRRRTQ